METKLTKEKQDSIKINRTSQGKYSWEIKLYFDAEKEDYNDVVEELMTIDEKLNKSFEGVKK